MSAETADAPMAAVVIPVKNGGERFAQVVKRVLEQETPWSFEVLVIDSGSNDDSPQRARRAGVRVHEIPASEFGHGKTRNLGAQLTRGRFVCFLTHDALPQDRHWLRHLVEAADSDEQVAGAFGRHRAYPQAGPVTRRELDAHFSGFGDALTVTRMEDPERYRREPGYRQFLHFFSNNNSCLRRTVWEQVPFPELDFAEDQAWAQRVIEAGWSRAYAADAVVYHSHEFGVIETGRRAFDESLALFRIFGYVLVPSPRRLLADWRYLVRRDWGWIWQEEQGLNRWGWLLRAPFLDLARLLGHYAGPREARLPRWMALRISRDKALQRQ